MAHRRRGRALDDVPIGPRAGNRMLRSTSHATQEKVRWAREDPYHAVCRCSASPARCCQSAGKWGRRVPLASQGSSCRNRPINASFLPTCNCGESVASAECPSRPPHPHHTHHPPTSSAACRAGCFPLGLRIQMSVMSRNCGGLSPDFLMCSLAQRSASADGDAPGIWY